MAEQRPPLAYLLAPSATKVRVCVTLALVQPNVAGASFVFWLLLQVTTNTNVFADPETVKFGLFVRGMAPWAKVEMVNDGLSTTAIAALAGAAHSSMAMPQSSGKITRRKRGWFFINWICLSLVLTRILEIYNKKQTVSSIFFEKMVTKQRRKAAAK
jgi:hypothetical protein